MYSTFFLADAPATGRSRCFARISNFIPIFACAHDSVRVSCILMSLDFFGLLVALQLGSKGSRLSVVAVRLSLSQLYNLQNRRSPRVLTILICFYCSLISPVVSHLQGGHIENRKGVGENLGSKSSRWI
jgi:hypothetical protein